LVGKPGLFGVMILARAAPTPKAGLDPKPSTPVPIEKLPSQFTPSCLAALRFISTTWTLSSTCSLEVATIMLTTFSGPLAKPAAICAARLASAALGTVPVRTMFSFTASSSIAAPGIMRSIMAAIWDRSRSTRTSSVRICAPFLSKKKAFVSPAALPIR
jgi:hypothetical protein